MANHYVRAGAAGTADGSDWTNAWTDLPFALTRGDTYYVADGSYATYEFNDAVSTTLVITVKKATIADHGTETGWDASYGDGQAVFATQIKFTSSYFTFDGNGTHTIPSDDSTKYGFKVDSDSLTNYTGIIAFGSGNAVSNITFKYAHVYNTSNGSENCGTVGLRYYVGYNQTYIKVQNCLLENSGKDGIQISTSSFLLFERNYIKRYGKLEAGTPDVHGQTVQLFYGGDDIIFRYNIWESCEGQGLIQIAGIGTITERVRFYGNLVFNKYGETTAASGGFNSSGGIIGNAWAYNYQDAIYIYNNTFVNVGGDYGGHAHFPMGAGGTNEYGYNNLFFNCGGNVGATGFDAWDYHASGGCDRNYGGANEQTGLTSAIFSDYESNDFMLASNTTAGKVLDSEVWWDEADTFFDYLDSSLDMYGRDRKTWSRGAFEMIDAMVFGESTAMRF
jgi:hypothetical protein